MKILIDKQIKEADRITIKNEPIASIDLMERASHVIAKWFENNIATEKNLFFFIGKGNNGGDGLAVARLLSEKGYRCSLGLVAEQSEMTEECKINFERLPKEISVYQGNEISVPEDAVIIDAILGTGFRGSLDERIAAVVEKINSLSNTVISIDLPSGMKTEFGNLDQKIVKADITLTLQFPKLAMLLSIAGECCGKIEVLPIGLDSDFLQQAETKLHYICKDDIKSIKKSRNKFTYKSNFGHALLICGSETMAGAALLATKAALRSGCGLVTLHLPERDRMAAQVACPSAILSLDPSSHYSIPPTDLSKYSVIGVGCGMGQGTQTEKAFKQLMEMVKQPMVLDADALNILAKSRELQLYIPAYSILTPHIGELRRLLGSWKSEQEKLKLTKALAARLRSVIVVKGAHSMVCMPDGRLYFNSTGNSGMAKAGSGDVLTGLLTGLMARGYNSEEAALLGVYYHGLAGDKATETFGTESMNSQDMIDFIKL